MPTYLKLLLAVFLVAVSAQITVNVGPIPVSGQSLAVLLVGFFLGPFWGASAIVLYLFLGGIGLPLFADGASGFRTLIGGSGGFLWGFILGAYGVGALGEKGWGGTFLQSLLLMFIGTVIIVTCGLIQLSILFDFPRALEYGLYPFIWGAIIKIIIGAVLIQLVKIK